MDIQSIHRGLKELPSDARERVSNVSLTLSLGFFAR